MKYEQFLKILSIFYTKMPIKKVSIVNNSYIFNRFWFWQRSHVVQYGLLSNVKVWKDPIKLQESIVDETWEILKNSINFHRKMPMKKGSLVNNSYIFEPILFLSTLLSSAIYLFVECTSLEGSDKASRVYSRWNMSNS